MVFGLDWSFIVIQRVRRTVPPIRRAKRIINIKPIPSFLARSGLVRDRAARNDANPPNDIIRIELLLLIGDFPHSLFGTPNKEYHISDI